MLRSNNFVQIYHETCKRKCHSHAKYLNNQCLPNKPVRVPRVSNSTKHMGNNIRSTDLWQKICYTNTDRMHELLITWQVLLICHNVIYPAWTLNQTDRLIPARGFIPSVYPIQSCTHGYPPPPQLHTTLNVIFFFFMSPSAQTDQEKIIIGHQNNFVISPPPCTLPTSFKNAGLNDMSM